jgi:hypothetical protein
MWPSLPGGPLASILLIPGEVLVLFLTSLWKYASKSGTSLQDPRSAQSLSYYKVYILQPGIFTFFPCSHSSAHPGLWVFVTNKLALISMIQCLVICKTLVLYLSFKRWGYTYWGLDMMGTVPHETTVNTIKSKPFIKPGNVEC